MLPEAAGTTTTNPTPNTGKRLFPPRNRRIVIALGRSFFHRIEERGSGFRRMRDQMLNHGLDQPLLGTDTGYFQVTFPGPGENLDRIRVPEARLTVTPAIEARLNERQRKMLQRLAQGLELTSRACEAEFGVTRPATASDFGKLVALRLAEKIGGGRSTRYRFKASEYSLRNRKGAASNRKPPARKETN